MPSTMHPTPEQPVVELLNNLSDVQTELLEVLKAKRQAMLGPDQERMEQLQQQETQLGERLEAIQQRRSAMLAEAKQHGRAARSLKELVRRGEYANRDDLLKQVELAAHQMRLVQHESLTNWVLAQRTLLHLSQMIEIIATRGRPRPTYGNESNDLNRGALVDREV